MFNLYDCVRLKKDRDDLGIKATFGGTVIDVLENGAVYTVEFFDTDNKTAIESIFTHFAKDELVLAERE